MWAAFSAYSLIINIHKLPIQTTVSTLKFSDQIEERDWGKFKAMQNQEINDEWAESTFTVQPAFESVLAFY